LNERIGFRWNFKTPPQKVVAEIFDMSSGKGTSKALFHKEIAGTSSLEYPVKGIPSILVPGKSYIILISGTFEPSKGKFSTSSLQSNFTVITKQNEKLITESIRDAKESQKENPDDYSSLIKVLIVYLDNNLNYEAVQVGKILEKKIPNNPNLNYYMSQAYMKLGQKSKAMEYERKSRT
jgi:hypothetical protein